MAKIDNLDLRILDIIMHNARMPSKDVGQLCNISRAAVHQRVQRLVEMGVITGSGYTVDVRRLGYGTCSYIGLTLERAEAYPQVVEQLRDIPEIVECNFTTGTYGILLKIYARDNEHLLRILRDRIHTIPGVSGTETMMSLECSISRQVPVLKK